MKKLCFFLGLFLSKSFLFIKVRINYFRNVFHSGVFTASLRNKPRDLFVDRSYSLIGGKNVTIGDNFIGNKGLIIETLTHFSTEIFSPSILIGNNVFMNQNCRLQCIDRIEIGNGALLAGNIFITDHFHGNTDIFDDRAPAQRNLYSKGPVIIGDYVWIGEGAVIMPNVKIGKHSIIGANSVVTKDVEEYSVVAGIPARTIKNLIA